MLSTLALLSLVAPAGAQEPPEPPTSGEEDPEAPAELPIIEGPSITEYVEAPYPAEAEEAGLEAVVRLLIELDAEGMVVNVSVPEPVGNGFDEAAVDAVLEMTFTPARTEEGPVPVLFEFEYGFTLTPAEPPPEEPDAPAPVNLEGTVQQMGTRRPIEGAKVVVDGTDLVATTDAEGAWSLQGAPLGTITLRLLKQDHVTEEIEVEVVEGEVTIAKLWMRAQQYRENEVVATYEREKEEVTRRTISIEEIKRVPGTFGDPVRVIQTLPGAARTPFGTGLLVIRGADPEDTGVYIDGIRIPIIYHLTGTTSVLSPELIEAVDYLPGGYGVQYGRTMGGAVDVRTRTEFEEQGKIVWGTDILDSQLYYEGRLGKNKQHGLALGARRSYIDVFIPIFTAGTDFTLKPRYWDYQVKWVPELSEDQDFSVFVYGFEDVLEVATPEDVAQGADADTQGDLRVQYASHRMLATWRPRVSEKTSLLVTPSMGYDGAYFGLGQDFVLEQTQFLLELRSELRTRPVPAVEFVPGIDFFGGFWGFDFISAVQFEDVDDPLAEREGVSFDGSGSAWTPDLFAKVNLRPLGGDARDRLLITPGIRYNYVVLDVNGEIEGDEPLPPAVSTSFDPRVSTRFDAVPERLALKASTGLYHQPPQPQEIVGVGTQSDVGHEQAWNSSIGFEHRITPSIHYDLDLFYRYMTDLIVFNEEWDGFGSNPFINAGDGRAFGAEVIARHDPTGRFFGWVSYTLSRSQRRDSPDCTAAEGEPELTVWESLTGDGPCWYAFDFDQTHIFSAQAGYDLPLDFGISAQVQYVTGNPTSTFNAGIYDSDADFYNGFRIGESNDERLPPFFQTSLRFDKLWTFRTWQLETYVDLLNAVRGINPEFLIYNYDYTESAYVRGLPFIPNIGIEARFWL